MPPLIGESKGACPLGRRTGFMPRLRRGAGLPGFLAPVGGEREAFPPKLIHISSVWLLGSDFVISINQIFVNSSRIILAMRAILSRSKSGKTSCNLG